MAEYVWSAARLQEKSWDREDKSAQMYSAFDEANAPGQDELRAYPSLLVGRL
jgi:hypothetical protein